MPLTWIACALALLGHNPDTSYARVEITDERVQTRLTLDIFTLRRIVTLDDNDNGELSRRELAGHASQIYAFLRKHVSLSVATESRPDDKTEDLGEPAGFVWPPDVGDAIRELDYHSANGLIHFDFVRPVNEIPTHVAIDFAALFRELGERHTVLGVFVTKDQEYEATFESYAPDFEFATGMAPSLWHRLARFFKLGVEHIFLGYDHICFLTALIVVSKFREVVKIVTSFTIAHSITLILATLQVVSLPPRLVESCIAATIVYVAVENLWVQNTGHRWWLTFFFGLVHGFGFAGVLREMGLPATGLVRCLLSFNVGVEFGQLVIALALLPLAWGLGQWKHGRKVVVGISILLASFGALWLVDRAFALNFMPF